MCEFYNPSMPKKNLLLFALIALSWLMPAQAEQILSAQYANPTTRYGHFALGAPHEYASVIATTDQGRTLTLNLPESEVFEDLSPRLVSMHTNTPAELLTIVSAKAQGARLALLGIVQGRLQIVAESKPIGQQNRWLNPVGVIDLDGDGVAEIAAVTTPHIGGILRVYKRQGAELNEVAALNGFSNHVFGSIELGLSQPARVDGAMRLIVPNFPRTSLIAIALKDSELVKTGQCKLATAIVKPSDLLACGHIEGHLFVPNKTDWQSLP